MTKVELLAILEQYEDDDIFLVASDEEGNSYREARLDEPEKAIDRGYAEWDILNNEDIADGYYTEEELEKAVRVGVFW